MIVNPIARVNGTKIPNREETPAKCKLKIAKSTEPPEWL